MGKARVRLLAFTCRFWNLTRNCTMSHDPSATWWSVGRGSPEPTPAAKLPLLPMPFDPCDPAIPDVAWLASRTGAREGLAISTMDHDQVENRMLRSGQGSLALRCRPEHELIPVRSIVHPDCEKLLPSRRTSCRADEGALALCPLGGRISSAAGLQLVQEVHGKLGVARGGEDRAFVGVQQF